MKEIRQRWLRTLYKNQQAKEEESKSGADTVVDDEYQPDAPHPSDDIAEDNLADALHSPRGELTDDASTSRLMAEADGNTKGEALSEAVLEDMEDFDDDLDLFGTEELKEDDEEALDQALRENLDLLLHNASSNDKVLMASKISRTIGQANLERMEEEMAQTNLKPCALTDDQRSQICAKMSQLTCEFDQEARFVENWNDARKRYDSIEMPIPDRASDKFSHEVMHAHINQAFFRPGRGGDLQHWYPAIVQSDFDIRTMTDPAKYRAECYDFYKAWAECAYETNFEAARLELNCDGKQSDGFVGFGLTAEFVAIAINCRMPPFVLAECSKQYARCPQAQAIERSSLRALVTAPYAALTSPALVILIASLLFQIWQLAW